MKFKLIIPASGTGSRYSHSAGSKTPKQFLKIQGKEVLASTLAGFHSIKEIDEIIIATRREFIDKVNRIVRDNKLFKVKHIAKGGATRQDSVYASLITLKCDPGDIIIIHDAVRPYISRKKIMEMMEAAKKYKAVIPGIMVSDTIKRTGRNNYITETIDRKNLWSIQTPQFFRYDILKDSFEKANKNNFKGTDESMIVEMAGYNVKIIEGEKSNIKITTKEDLR
jgi:2-C-methyl-D-erythritol 4-phosphate cytidylyltransferase